MSRWLLKSGAQRVISLLPHSERWNAFLQRHVTKGLKLRQHGEFEGKLVKCRRHLERYQEFSLSPKRDFSVVEIGTGWFPIIPIGLYLCGAREIWTFDIVRLVSASTLAQVVNCFQIANDSGELAQLLPLASSERIGRLLEIGSIVKNTPPAECLELLNIHAIVGDVRSSGLAEGSTDLIFSNGVLEHISPAPLRELFAEFRRLASRDSVMCHYIGIADQFASFDRSITPFNYMRYTNRAWRWLDNPIIPQNRLKVSDYRRAYVEAGFEIVDVEDIEGAEGDLDSIRLAPEFAHYSRHDLLVLYSWLVARAVISEPRPAGQTPMPKRGTRQSC
jgi:hypothetical protein